MFFVRPRSNQPLGLLFPRVRAKPNALPMSKTLPPNAGWGAWEACGFLFTASPRLAVCIHVHRRTTDASHTPIGAPCPPASAQLSHPFSGTPTPRASYSSVWCPASSFEDYDGPSRPFSVAPTPRASYSSMWCPASSFEDYDGPSRPFQALLHRGLVILPCDVQIQVLKTMTSLVLACFFLTPSLP